MENLNEVVLTLTKEDFANLTNETFDTLVRLNTKEFINEQNYEKSQLIFSPINKDTNNLISQKQLVKNIYECLEKITADDFSIEYDIFVAVCEKMTTTVTKMKHTTTTVETCLVTRDREGVKEIILDLKYKNDMNKFAFLPNKDGLFDVSCDSYYRCTSYSLTRGFLKFKTLDIDNFKIKLKDALKNFGIIEYKIFTEG